MDADILRESIAKFGEPPVIGHAVAVMHEGLGREKWLASRVVGASDAPGIMGVSKYSSPRKVWRRLNGYDDDFAGNYHTRRGNAMEPVGLVEFSERTGIRAHKPGWLLRHPSHDWLTCTLDGWTEDGEVVEVKAPGDRVVSDMKRLIDGVEVCPVGAVAGYIIQMHHQMLVTGTPSGWLVVMPGTSEPMIAHVRLDVGLIAKMLKTLSGFWQQCIDQVEPEPMPHDIADLAREWKRDHGELETTGGRLAELFADLAQKEAALADIVARQAEAIQSAKDDVAAAKLRIITKARVHRAKKLTVIDGGRKHKVTWFQKSAGLDTKRLRKDHPELAKEYTKDPPAPQFTVTAGKER